MINNIPNLIDKIAYGYIFIIIYSWCSFHEKNNYKMIIIKGIIGTYILSNFYNALFEVTGLEIFQNVIFLIILSVILGYVSFKIMKADSTKLLFKTIGITRTDNTNIWDDIIKKGTCLRIYTKDKDISYLGQVKFIEEFAKEPIVVLQAYQIIDTQGEVITDYSKDINELAILNLKNFEKVDLTYLPEK